MFGQINLYQLNRLPQKDKFNGIFFGLYVESYDKMGVANDSFKNYETFTRPRGQL